MNLAIQRYGLSGKTLSVSALSIAYLLTVTGLLFFNINDKALSRARSDKASFVSSVGATASDSPATGATSSANAPMLEMHIANNGLVLLRGAQVLSIEGKRIRIGQNWGGQRFMWTVQTEKYTKIFSQKGEKAELSDITAGDIIKVTGKLIGGGSEPIINADFIRE